MFVLSNQIGDSPVTFPVLNIFQLKVNEFGSAKAASSATGQRRYWRRNATLQTSAAGI
jgi:hypothetical protein